MQLYRDAEAELTPLAWLALQTKIAPHLPHDSSGDEQAET